MSDNKKVIQVEIVNVFGRDWIYPVSDLAKDLATKYGSIRFFTDEDIEQLKKMGFEIKGLDDEKN